jgi:hypothetical protein
MPARLTYERSILGDGQSQQSEGLWVGQSMSRRVVSVMLMEKLEPGGIKIAQIMTDSALGIFIGRSFQRNPSEDSVPKGCKGVLPYAARSVSTQASQKPPSNQRRLSIQHKANGRLYFTGFLKSAVTFPLLSISRRQVRWKAITY